MRSSAKNIVECYQSALQKGLGPLVVVTKHLIERLIERVPLSEMDVVIKQIVKRIKTDLCVIAYESVVVGNAIRIRVANFKLVCWTNVDAQKLVLRTIY